jgi:predicted AAA+ superfamily ATPase
LDEWQRVPEVLGAVKRSVDQGAGPGSYILAGSVRAPLTSESWPGTGRVITVDMHPMTVLERHASAASGSDLVGRLMAGDIASITVPPEPPDIVGYVELAVTGGYPPVLATTDSGRNLWFRSYIDQLVLRDVPEVGEIRDPGALHKLLTALSECTGALVADTELAAAAEMNVKTVRRQERLLEDLRVVTALPAWRTNRLSRLTKQRKRYTVDTGMTAALLELDSPAIRANGELLGRILETFVLAQLRPLLDVADRRVSAYHLRQQDGRREVDIVLEGATGHVVGIEIKASASPSARDARHLCWLRDELGDRFTAGVVLHTGKAAFPLGERITALPIAVLWS